MPRLSSDEPPEGTTASTRMTKADVLDLLEALSPDRLLAVYRPALPLPTPQRRRITRPRSSALPRPPGRRLASNGPVIRRETPSLWQLFAMVAFGIIAVMAFWYSCCRGWRGNGSGLHPQPWRQHEQSQGHQSRRQGYRQPAYGVAKSRIRRTRRTSAKGRRTPTSRIAATRRSSPSRSRVGVSVDTGCRRRQSVASPASGFDVVGRTRTMAARPCTYVRKDPPCSSSRR